MYTAIVLDQQSQQQLIARFGDIIPADWERLCHHMTINLNSASTGPAAALLGQPAELNVTSISQNELVMAVGVETSVPSTNSIKHITLAVNRKGGGKPFHSNKLTDWHPTSPLKLHGTIQEEN